MTYSKEQIQAFNEYQHSGVFHPYTCGSGNRTDKNHLDGEGLLELTESSLKCPYCDYTQNWVNSGIFDLDYSKSPYPNIFSRLNNLKKLEK